MIPILIKMFTNKVTVVECKNEESDEAVEYDPFNPEERWGAKVQWKDENELIIKVGEYSLRAKRNRKDTNYFLGIESGPNGEILIDVYLLDLEEGTQPRKLESALRLAKIAQHSALIIDSDANGKGKGKEYDPFNLNEKWDTSIFWRTNDEIEISTGPYCLKAWRVHDGVVGDFFQGIEAGPQGNSKFNIYLLSRNASRLINLPSTEWLMFRGGKGYFRVGNLVNSKQSSKPVSRRLGVAALKFPKTLETNIPNDENCHGYGLLGGRHETMRVASIPTEDNTDTPLTIYFDNYVDGYKFTWEDYRRFQRNDNLCAYTERDSMILFPIR